MIIAWLKAASFFGVARWLWLLVAAAVLIAAFSISGALSGDREAEVEARLNRNQGEAAVRSGADAVGTLGRAGAREDAIDQEVSNAQNRVRNAPDAGSADAAARDGLCRLSPDYCEPD